MSNTTSEVISFLSDLQLIDFYDRKTNRDLINIEQLREMFREYSLNNITLTSISNISTMLEDFYSPILDILIFGNGKISLCGFGLSQIIRGIRVCEFDLYLHSCSLKEASSILSRYISATNFKPNSYCKRDNYIIFIDDDQDGYGYYIRIFFEVYESEKQILTNYCCLDKHCWNPISGYLCSNATEMSLLTDISPINDDEDINPKSVVNILSNINRYIMEGPYKIQYGPYRFNRRDVQYIFCSPRIEEDKLTYLEGIVDISKEIASIRFFNPNISDTKIFIKRYHYINVGISNDKYVVLNNIKKGFNINADVFGLLCLYYLEQEVLLAKERITTKEHI